MLFKSAFNVAALLVGTLIASVAAEDLPSIEVVGNKFYFANNGSQFYMRGVAYQQDTQNSTDSTFVDPLANPVNCKRDIPYLQELNTNVIRVYALNVSLDHTECMSMLQDAGIYVIADLSQPDESINRNSPSWDIDLYDRYCQVVDLFHNYTNVLGFFAGNEVTNDDTNTDASAYVKAAVRDTKAYIKAQGYRSIPVGYSANDDSDIRVALADYFACGDVEERADFFGINMYEWCGDSSFKSSGYQTITEDYKDLGIPIFFSEYGCNRVTPRKFTEVQALYGSDMTGVWSGGIVYMYFEEENNYGLVSVLGSSVKTLKDFKNLKSQLASISPSSALIASGSSSSVSVTQCPTSASTWAASTNLPPFPDEEVCKCMSDSLGCVVSSSVDEDDYGDLYSYICEKVDCSGISGNGTSGKYGSYSFCSAKDMLSFALNLYYLDHDSDKSACDFSGSASTKKAKTASSCSAIIKSAGTKGTGKVSTSIATTKHTATGSGSRSGSTSGSTSGSSGDSSSSSSSAGGKSSNGPKQSSIDAMTVSMLVGVSVICGFGFIFA